jgi:hypothetical protein
MHSCTHSTALLAVSPALCVYCVHVVTAGFKPVLSVEGLRRATSYGGNVFVASTQQQQQQQQQQHRHSVAGTADVHSASVGTQRSTRAQANSSGDEATAPSFRELARPQASHLSQKFKNLRFSIN